MAEHVVRINQLPEVELAHKNLVISVYSNDEKLGDLTISRGGLGWFPKGPSSERHFSWEQFVRRMREGKKRKPRRKTTK